MPGVPIAKADTVEILSATLPGGPRGYSAAAWDGARAFVFGGYSDATGRHDSIVRYDPATGNATTMAARLPSARFAPTAVWAGSFAYVIGGWAGSNPGTDEIVRYDPATDAVRVMAARLPTGRNFASAVWDGTYAWIFGGQLQLGDAALDDILRYDPATDTIATMTEKLPTKASGLGAVWDGRDRPADGCPGGCAYLFGGQFSSPTLYDQVVRYNPTNHEAVALPQTLPAKYVPAATVWDGTHAYLLGGFGNQGGGNQAFGLKVRYDPETDAVTTLDVPLPKKRCNASGVWDGSHAIMFGGDCPYTDEILRFTPGDDPDGLRARHRFDAALRPIDDSGHALDGAYHGSIWASAVPSGRTTAGAIGPSFSLADYASIPDVAVSPLAEGTVEAWVYFDPAQFHGGQILDFLRDSTGIHFGITPTGSSPSRWHLQARIGSGAINMESASEVPLRTWTHVAVTWNGSEVKLYLNETLDARHAHTGTVSGTGDVFVGRISSDNTWSFQGYIDDLTISGVAKDVAKPPGPPRGLDANSGPGAGEITLTWTAPASDGGAAITAYEVHRGNASGIETFLATLGNVLTFTDSGLGNGVTKFYTVRARNVAGAGAASNEASATTGVPPSAPRNLTATTELDFQHVDLAWEAPADGGRLARTQYVIYRTKAATGGTTDIRVPADATSYRDLPPAFGVYEYAITAVNPAGEGPTSNEECAVGGRIAAESPAYVQAMMASGCPAT